MTSTITVKDGGEFLISVNVGQDDISEKACFLELGSCDFAGTGNAPYSRSDPSDLDMVKIEAKLLLYNHDSCSDSSCNEEDDLEALASYLDTRDIKLNLDSRNVERKLPDKERTHRHTLTVKHGSRHTTL